MEFTSRGKRRMSNALKHLVGAAAVAAFALGPVAAQTPPPAPRDDLRLVLLGT
jgi:hypothetical protein